MATVDFKVNGATQSVDADPSTPLLWVLRDHLGLTGTKYGCGVAQCGACTVHLNGEAVRSCGVSLDGLAGAEVVTIEGLAARGGETLQRLWAEVPRCKIEVDGDIATLLDLTLFLCAISLRRAPKRQRN